MAAKPLGSATMPTKVLRPATRAASKHVDTSKASTKGDLPWKPHTMILQLEGTNKYPALEASAKGDLIWKPHIRTLALEASNNILPWRHSQRETSPGSLAHGFFIWRPRNNIAFYRHPQRETSLGSLSQGFFIWRPRQIFCLGGIHKGRPHLEASHKDSSFGGLGQL
jgi:hypothetical protein